MSTKPARRVSASRLAAIETCTMQFYLKEILGLPEKQWEKTAAGSAAHSVLEALRKDKNREYHDRIKEAQTIYAVPAIGRLVRAWHYKTRMSDKIVADIDAMCLVAINDTNFLDLDADERFEPEHEFKLTFANGAELKGFIDRLARHGDVFRIHDYKSAGRKKTKLEVEDNYQSLSYQLYVWLTFGKLAEVRYYFLRFPPSKRYPGNHVMITMPATPTQLKGFALYVQHMWEVINAFSPQDATSGYCIDEGFCDNVCSFRRPFKYLKVKAAGSDDEKRYWVDPKTGKSDYQPRPGDKVEETKHPGCPRWNPA